MIWLQVNIYHYAIQVSETKCWKSNDKIVGDVS